MRGLRYERVEGLCHALLYRSHECRSYACSMLLVQIRLRIVHDDRRYGALVVFVTLTAVGDFFS